MTKSNHRHLAVFDAHLLPIGSNGEASALGSSAQGSSAQGSEGGDGSTDGELLQVGDLAKLTGKTVRAIHLYEDLGLLKPIDRSKGRFRLFNQESLQRVRWITKLQTLGLSLTEIGELVQELERSPSARA